MESVDELTAKLVMDYQRHRASMSPATRLCEREILHAMMNYAVRVVSEPGVRRAEAEV